MREARTARMAAPVAATALALAALAAGAVPAQAGTVTATLGPAAAPGPAKVTRAIRFEASTGESNDLSVSLAGADLLFSDSAALLTAGAGCTQIDEWTASCPAGAGTERRSAVARLGDQDDSARVGFPPQAASQGKFTVALDGGPGNDFVTGPEAAGGEGADKVTGTGGADVLSGGRGKDTLIGKAGNDRLIGDAEDALQCGAGAFDVYAGLPATSLPPFGCDYLGVLVAGRVARTLDPRPQRRSGGAVAAFSYPKCGSATCVLSLRLTALVGGTRRTVGTATRQGPGSAPFLVTLTPAARALLARVPQRIVRVTIRGVKPRAETLADFSVRMF